MLLYLWWNEVNYNYDMMIDHYDDDDVWWKFFATDGDTSSCGFRGAPYLGGSFSREVIRIISLL